MSSTFEFEKEKSQNLTLVKNFFKFLILQFLHLCQKMFPSKVSNTHKRWLALKLTLSLQQNKARQITLIFLQLFSNDSLPSLQGSLLSLNSVYSVSEFSIKMRFITLNVSYFRRTLLVQPHKWNSIHVDVIPSSTMTPNRWRSIRVAPVSIRKTNCNTKHVVRNLSWNPLTRSRRSYASIHRRTLICACFVTVTSRKCCMNDEWSGVLLVCGVECVISV